MADTKVSIDKQKPTLDIMWRIVSGYGNVIDANPHQDYYVLVKGE